MNDHKIAIIQKIGDKECVTQISEPQTIVGRGKIFEVSDKRVSRTHAELLLDCGALTLKSTHSNPCFLNLKNRNKKILLKQGCSIVLEHGDEFSLLQDKYFFLVSIQIKGSQNQKCSQEIIVQSEISSNAVAAANIKTENCAMATKTENPLNVGFNNKFPKASERNEAKKKLKKVFIKSMQNSNDCRKNNFPKKRKLPSWMLHQSKNSISKSETALINASDGNPDQTVKNESFTNVTDTKTKIKCISSSIVEDEMLKNSKFSIIVSDEMQSEPKFLKNLGKTSDNNRSISSAYLNLKDDSDAETSAKDTASTISDLQQNELANSEDTLTKANGTSMIGEFQRNDLTLNSIKQAKILDPDAVELDSRRNSPSSFNNSSGHVQTREPCVYGKSCYRKNPDHFNEYSHPGDADYFCNSSSDDDDNDHRPECEYGLQCYRKNLSHKRKFKHTIRITPKRLATKQKNAATADGHNSDDYDLDDSFIDDDDLEEEDLSDDSDWAPSGNKKDKKNNASDNSTDEDVSDLLTSAKKFVKNKKLWKK